DGVRHLEELGAKTYLELGPDGLLSAMARGCLTAEPRLLAPLLRADRPGAATTVAALGQAWVLGGGLDAARLAAESGGRRIELPTYAFQQRSYWLHAPASTASAADVGFWAAVARADAPALAEELGIAGADEQTRQALDALLPALADWHSRTFVPGVVLLPDEAPEDETADDTARTRLASLLAPERRALLLELVRRRTAEVLGHDAVDEIDPDGAFPDLGLSSFTGLELRNLLCADTGLPLPPVVVFEYATPAALTAYLDAELAPDERHPDERDPRLDQDREERAT
ncbi:MAG: hypothetical protein HOV68_29750, partial [Streptomycetaceae bacterium]|nr:hypothetical protein [Streptomycetaceae bacterium]